MALLENVRNVVIDAYLPCVRLTDEGVKRLADRCDRLECVDLSYVSLSDESVIYLLKRNPRISVLSVYYTCLTPRFLEFIKDNETLWLFRVFKPVDVDETCLNVDCKAFVDCNEINLDFHDNRGQRFCEDRTYFVYTMYKKNKK